jgi:hypothetical protein
MVPTPPDNQPGPALQASRAIQAIRAVQASSPADPAIQPRPSEKLTTETKLIMSRRRVRPRADPGPLSVGLRLRTSCQLRHVGFWRAIQAVTISNWSTGR